MKRLFLFAAIGLPALPSGYGQPPAAGASSSSASSRQAREALASAREVLELPRTAARRGFPVEMRGIVTLALAGDGKIFVQDASGGIFVHVASSPEIAQGDLVTVKGTTSAGRFAPSVELAIVSPLGRGALPTPRRLSLHDFRNVSYDCLFVEVEATVRSVYQVNNRWQINLHHDGTRMPAFLVDPSGSGRPRPGDLVRIRGIASSTFNAKGQSLGGRLLIQKGEQIQVLRQSDNSQTSLPIRKIGEILTYETTPPLDERIRVRGSVTCNNPDGTVCIQNEADGLVVHTGAPQDLRLGELVEVIGFPSLNSYSPRLEDVSIRRLGRIVHVRPAATSVAEAQSGRHDGRLLELPGTIVLQKTMQSSQQKNGTRWFLTLRDGARVFTAELSNPPSSFPDGARTGSQVRVTGVCQITATPSLASENSFHLQMRTPEDLKVVEAASWWTRDRALQAVGALGVAVALGLFWLALLRRKVQAQTSIIRGQLHLETALAERYRDLFENSTDLVFTIDTHGTFKVMNYAAKMTFGCTENETSALSLRSFVKSEDLPTLKDVLALLLGGERSVLRHMSVMSWTGRVLILEMNCRLRHGNGGPNSIDIIARDVTEQRREQAALEEARAAAEAASRSKSEFLANMSHEIRTPMNGILGMTELTLATSLSEDQRTNLDVVKSSAEALLTIINDILDFSKIEAGCLELERHPFEFVRLIEGCIDLVSLPAAQKGLELICDIDPTLPSHWIGDAARLRQVLLNLIGNAVKFTDSGEVVLRVEAIRSNDGACQARFCVQDTGIGIPVEQHKRIFEMFCQADGSISRKYGGTGLGLAIASRLVALMGGRLMLESAPDTGSLFSFLIDVVPRSAVQVVEAEKLHGTRALILDTNATSRNAIVRSLTYAGVRIVEDGQAEVAISPQDRPDLEIPVILMLAPGQAVPESHHAAAMLRKPITAPPLLKAIQTITQTRSVLALDAGSRKFESPGSGNEPIVRATVLLAEDNKVNQMLAVRTLEKRGYRVLVANNGIEAVRLAKDAEIDIILMDIQMPEMDGFQATAKIQDARKASALQAPPVIAMTAHALKGDRERCLSAGMTDYISKPVKPADLLEMVARYTAQPEPQIG